MECEIQADLKPVTVKWLHNEEELHESVRVQEVFVEETGLARLTVKDVTPDDAGEYACVVSGHVTEPRTGVRESKTIITKTYAEITGELLVHPFSACYHFSPLFTACSLLT